MVCLGNMLPDVFRRVASENIQGGSANFLEKRMTMLGTRDGCTTAPRDRMIHDLAGGRHERRDWVVGNGSVKRHAGQLETS